MLDGLITINLTLVVLMVTVVVVLGANVVAMLINTALRIYIKVKGL